jgi:hypothetical protein
MARYATGKHAKSISDRSGLEYRYKDMRKEWNGLLVGKEVYDPQTLKDPRPNTNNIFNTKVTFPVFNLTTVRYEDRVPQAEGQVGTVTVSIT